MKKLLLLCFLTVLSANAATTYYTDWYVDNATGANTNSGSTATSPTLSVVSGDWTQSTCTFVKAGADLSTINNTMWASVYANGGTVAAYVAKISSVNDGTDTIVLSTTAKAGTSPGDSTGGMSITIGGPWAGPSATVDFPFGFVTATLTNASSIASGYPSYVNFKSGTTYSVTDQIECSLPGPIYWGGYTTTVRDGGRATIDGGTVDTAFILLNIAAAGVNQVFSDFIFSHNGASGATHGVNAAGPECIFYRCVFTGMNRHGLASTTYNRVIECEAYGNNVQNVATFGGFNGAYTAFIRCISHDNANNGCGFVLGSSSVLENCISDSNGALGVYTTSTVDFHMRHCDIYANGGDGLNLAGATAGSFYIENCNFVDNGGYGINSTGSTVRNGLIVKPGFGSGDKANTSGDVAAAVGLLRVIDAVIYTADATPWNAPATGDFCITSSESQNQGRGTFLQTAADYLGTVAYPDLGAAQHTNAVTTAGGSFPFLQ